MSNLPCSTASATQNNLISIAQDHCRFMELFAMPTAVELLQCTSVGSCGCPISSRVNQNITACLQLRKRAPSSASAAEATTKCKIAHSVKNLKKAPLLRASTWHLRFPPDHPLSVHHRDIEKFGNRKPSFLLPLRLNPLACQSLTRVV